MKTRKTTFVAVLSQTFTTSSTFTTTSRSYADRGNFHADPHDGNSDAVATVTAPLARGGPQWCAECATPMAMMSPELAATVCFQTTRAIYRLVEAGRIHFTDGPEGVRVCPASLMKDWACEQAVRLLAAASAQPGAFEIERT